MEKPVSCTLKSLEGTMVVASIPALGKDLCLVRLHKVESAGVWVESQRFTERLMTRCAVVMSKTTALMFVPFSGVSYLLSSVDRISLSERGLGLRNDPE